MITVVAPAAPDQLLTKVTSFKAMMSITDTLQDLYIADLIAAASQWIANYCNRSFGKERVIETVGGSGTPRLLVSRMPILTLHSSELHGVAYEDVSVYDDKAGIIYRNTGFTSTVGLAPDTAFAPHPSSYSEPNWSINYTAGYVLPNWPSSFGVRTLPYDLERAALGLVTTYFRNKGMDESMTSYRIGDTAINWGNNNAEAEAQAAGVPRGVLTILKYYKRSI